MRVGLAGVGSVDVDAQDRREQVADVLAGVAAVGRARVAAVAGGDVEIAVGAELQAAAVVAAGGPVDHDRLALGVDTRRVGVGDLEARDARALRVAGLEDVADVDEAVLREVGMEREAVGAPVAGDLAEVEEQVGLSAQAWSSGNE